MGLQVVRFFGPIWPAAGLIAVAPVASVGPALAARRFGHHLIADWGVPTAARAVPTGKSALTSSVLA